MTSLLMTSRECLIEVMASQVPVCSLTAMYESGDIINCLSPRSSFYVSGSNEIQIMVPLQLLALSVALALLLSSSSSSSPPPPPPLLLLLQ